MIKIILSILVGVGFLFLALFIEPPPTRACPDDPFNGEGQRTIPKEIGKC